MFRLGSRPAQHRRPPGEMMSFDDSEKYVLLVEAGLQHPIQQGKQLHEKMTHFDEVPGEKGIFNTACADLHRVAVIIRMGMRMMMEP